jgi:hypothetical protein
MFRNWLNTIVCWDDVEYISRHTAIKRFVYKGLYPFIESHGYVIRGDAKTLTSAITTLLYKNRGTSCLNAKVFASSKANEYHDKSYFYHVISQAKWDSFWDAWSVWSDLNDWRGEDRRIDIQEYCWSQIDLDESPQTRVVDELLSYSDESPTNARGDDTYLREAAESNEWGGIR